MNRGGIALQRWSCSSPGLGAAPFFWRYGNNCGRRRVCYTSWLKGAQQQRWTAAAAAGGISDESSAREMQKKSKRGGGSGLQRCAVQLDSSRSSSTAIIDDGLEEIYGSDLQGFARRVASCNEGRERKAAEFLPFMVGNDTLGFIHHRFAQHLGKFPEVFSFQGVDFSVVNNEGRGNGVGSAAGGSVRLARSLSSPQQRTEAVQGVLEALKTKGLIPGWRDELLPVTLRYGAAPFFLMERAAFPFFGSKCYGVHINGYVNVDGETYLWVAKRSDSKQTFPGMLDHIVAGGQPEGISARDNVIKECDEEAAIPSHLAERAVAAGAISYEVIKGQSCKRDVLFCYDLELPQDFEPTNKDGEVQSFDRLPISEVMDIISKTECYKPNCALVVIDFFFRHGHITPEQKGYLSLLQSLRTGEL